MKELCNGRGTVLLSVRSVCLIDCPCVICLIVENVCIHSIYLNLKLILWLVEWYVIKCKSCRSSTICDGLWECQVLNRWEGDVLRTLRGIGLGVWTSGLNQDSLSVLVYAGSTCATTDVAWSIWGKLHECLRLWREIRRTDAKVMRAPVVLEIRSSRSLQWLKHPLVWDWCEDGPWAALRSFGSILFISAYCPEGLSFVYPHVGMIWQLMTLINCVWVY